MSTEVVVKNVMDICYSNYATNHASYPVKKGLNQSTSTEQAETRPVEQSFVASMEINRMPKQQQEDYLRSFLLLLGP